MATKRSQKTPLPWVTQTSKKHSKQPTRGAGEMPYLSEEERIFLEFLQELLYATETEDKVNIETCCRELRRLYQEALAA